MWDAVPDHDDDGRDDAAAHIVAVRKAVIESLLNDERTDVTVRDYQSATMSHAVNYNESWISPVVRTLIEKGVDTSARNHSGQTAFHMASLVGNLESVATLIAEGSSLGVSDNDGEAMIHYAARSHDILTIEAILLAHDDDAPSVLNLKDSNGRTALHHSIGTSYNDNAAVVFKLINLGARADVTDNLGNSPLAHCFTQFRFTSDTVLCHILLDFGAKEIRVNEDGETLADVYVTNGRVDVRYLSY